MRDKVPSSSVGASRSDQSSGRMRSVIASLVAPLVVVLGLIPFNIFGVGSNLAGPGAILAWLLVSYSIALAITMCVGLAFR